MNHVICRKIVGTKDHYVKQISQTQKDSYCIFPLIYEIQVKKEGRIVNKKVNWGRKERRVRMDDRGDDDQYAIYMYKRDITKPSI